MILPPPGTVNWKNEGRATFEDVSFRYEGAAEDALEHISFTAKPGETTAIIGSTGCGKSTLIHLIPRFYDVTAGRILIDGVDIREISQHKLRSLLGFVPQKEICSPGISPPTSNTAVPIFQMKNDRSGGNRPGHGIYRQQSPKAMKVPLPRAEAMYRAGRSSVCPSPGHRQGSQDIPV